MFSGNNSPETVPLVAWAPENIVEIDQKNLQLITEHICKRCRYPLLALRLFLHVLCNIDAQGRVSINARSTIYKKVKENSFPKPISLGAKSVGWLEADVQNWIEVRIISSQIADR